MKSNEDLKKNGEGGIELGSKKKILNIMIEEQVPKKHIDHSNSSYCVTF
jgi:hypothetical protein